MVNPFGPATDKQLALINDIKAVCPEVTPFMGDTKLAGSRRTSRHTCTSAGSAHTRMRRT